MKSQTNRTREAWRPVVGVIFFVGFMAAFRYFGSGLWLFGCVVGALLIFSWILLPKAPKFIIPWYTRSIAVVGATTLVVSLVAVGIATLISRILKR